MTMKLKQDIRMALEYIERHSDLKVWVGDGGVSRVYASRKYVELVYKQSVPEGKFSEFVVCRNDMGDPALRSRVNLMLKDARTIMAAKAQTPQG